MIISHKHKFIFVRPRKTAGTTMQNVLSKICGEDDIITSGYDKGNRNIENSCWNGHPHPHLWDIKKLVISKVGFQSLKIQNLKLKNK